MVGRHGAAPCSAV